MVLQSVQTAYKPLRTIKSKVPCHRNAAPPMEIPSYWRAKPRLVRWLHLRKKHINTKLKVWRGRKRAPSVGANSVQALTEHQIQGSLPPQCSAANGNSGLLTAKPRLVRWLHLRKNHINTKLKVWRGRKRAPSVGANSVQALTEHQIQGSLPPQCSASNGNSGLLTAKPRLVRWLH